MKGFRSKQLYVRTILLFIFILGIYSILTTSRERYPRVIQKKWSTLVVYPGATSSEVEEQVVKPIEESLKGVPEIQFYRSHALDQMAKVDAVFYDNTPNVVDVKSHLRVLVGNIKFPSNAGEPVYIDYLPSEDPVLYIGLTSDALSYGDLKQQAAVLRERLLNVEGVQGVDYLGYNDRYYALRMDENKLRATGLSLSNAVSQIQAQFLRVDGVAYQTDQRKNVLQVGGSEVNRERVEALTLFTPRNPKMKITDVAKIEEGYDNFQSLCRVHGKNAIVLLVKNKDKEDIFHVNERVQKITDDFSKSSSVSLSYVKDSSEETRNRLDVVESNVMMGAVLIIVILFIFLHFRAALWVVYSLFYSIIASFVVLKWIGVSINAVSLVAIILASGMLIDNAIVIVECVYKLKLRGYSWLKANVKALQQMFFPLLYSLITTLVSFIPMYYLKGDVGQWAKEIPVVITVVMVVSFFQSIFFLPIQLSYQKENKTVNMRDRRFMIRLRILYEIVLRWVVKWSKTSIAVSWILVIIATYYLFFVKSFVSYPDEGVSKFVFSGRVENSLEVSKTLEKIQWIEENFKVYDKKVLKNYFLTIGGIQGVDHFSFDVDLTDEKERRQSADDVITELQKKIAQRGGFREVSFVKDLGGLPEKSDIVFRLLSDDEKQRQKMLEEVMSLIAPEEIKSIVVDGNKTKRVQIFKPAYEKLFALGITPMEVEEQISASVGEKIIYKSPQQTDPIYLKIKIDQGTSQSDLEKVKFITKGQAIPITQLGRFETQEAPDTIYREQSKRAIIVHLNVSKVADIEKISHRLKNKLPQYFNHIESSQIILDGKVRENQEILRSISIIAIFVFVLIFVTLIFATGSIRRSIIVATAIPFGFIGVSLALFIHDMPLSYMALFGLIGLAGVVVNNSIILVSLIRDNMQWSHYDNIVTNVVHSARSRFRPILLTSVTAIAGLIPTAYKLGGKDYFIIPTTIVISWGLFFSTIVVLFIVPAFFVIYYGRKK